MMDDFQARWAPTLNTFTAGDQIIEDAPHAGTRAVAAPAQQSEQEAALARVKAFVTDINGRTIVTAPAGIVKANRQPDVDDITNEHMLRMRGRFVGGESANSNGAFWSSGDLEMGIASVTNGPLNWLHDARHVIGCLSGAEFIKGLIPAAGVESSAQPVQPHIVADAAIWKWIWPDEAYVVEQASDLGQLWYSMECISKEVACTGDNGCGNTTTYGQYMAGNACEHVVQRASTRRFKDPVFLGGAVIVPPTRPGWAEADARVMKHASELAEAAFDQAGQPDVPANEWEMLMTQLVKFADS